MLGLDSHRRRKCIPDAFLENTGFICHIKEFEHDLNLLKFYSRWSEMIYKNMTDVNKLESYWEKRNLCWIFFRKNEKGGKVKHLWQRDQLSDWWALGQEEKCSNLTPTWVTTGLCCPCTQESQEQTNEYSALDIYKWGRISKWRWEVGDDKVRIGNTDLSISRVELPYQQSINQLFGMTWMCTQTQRLCRR